MWNMESVSIAQSFLISGAGMLLVVMELAILAIAIKLFTGLISGFGKGSDGRAENKSAAINSSLEDENYAVILAVMNEELNSSGLNYRVTMIRETGN